MTRIANEGDFRRSVTLGLLGGICGVFLIVFPDVFPGFVSYAVGTVLSVGCLLAAFYYARRSNKVPI